MTNTLISGSSLVAQEQTDTPVENCDGGWLLENALGEALAVFEAREAQDYWIEAAKRYYDDAATCGHPSAAAWLAERAPLIVRGISCEERELILGDGPPVLQREAA
jgi:hypothetical protein